MFRGTDIPGERAAGRRRYEHGGVRHRHRRRVRVRRSALGRRAQRRRRPTPAGRRRTRAEPGAVTRTFSDGGTCSDGGKESDAGMVTAELAMALPTLLLVLAIGLYALATVALQARTADAAAAGARLFARGDDPEAIRSQLAAELPAGSTVTLTRREPSLVTVRVEAALPAPAALRPLVGGIRVGS